MDYIREAFFKVKQEMDELKNEVVKFSSELGEIREEMIKICEIVKEISQKAKRVDSTDSEEIPTESNFNSTDNFNLKPLNPKISHISTGNEGVQTDRQTIRQTDRQINFTENFGKNTINNATDILESLNSLKKELRLKFKRLTEQELIVFSKMYQLDEEKGYSDYKMLSEELKLTQSSIRDYVGRLILKEVPVEKIKVNNKNIQLKISENLKKIATLSTILQLREI